MDAARIFVLSAALVEVLRRKIFVTNHEIIADQDTRNGAEESRIADEPAENVVAVTRHELPRLHDDAHHEGDQSAGAKADTARRKIGEVVGGGDDVCGDVDVKRGHEEREHGDHHGPGVAETREHGDRIPQGFSKYDERCGGYGDADEGIKGHGGGKAQSLADHLISLAAGVTREIGNVKRNSSPETDHAGKRGNEEAKELGERVEFGGRGKHGAEAARFSSRPQEKRQPDEQQEWRGDALQKTDSLYAAQDDQNI